MSILKSSLKVYLEVIDDVINGVRDLFLEEGVDEQVLQELRGIWENKLRSTKAVDNQSEIDKQSAKKLNDVVLANGFQKPQPQQVKQVVGQVPPNNHVQTAAVPQIHDKQMVPIQVTLPAQPGGENAARVFTIQVPANALQGNQLSKVLTGPVMLATMSLPQAIASSLLQQHVNAAFSTPQGQPQGQIQAQQTATQQQQVVRQIANKPVIQSDGPQDCSDDDDDAHMQQPGPSTSSGLVFQIDGPMDTSDDDEDGSDDDDASEDADDDKDEDEQEVDEGGPEEEPLNSEDDVTDEDPTDLFDTENVVVCQYDKITRNRNKWKFHLKDGIMNLNGEDYLFQRATGDAEW
ncbi:transcription initiation factor IIA subunit 1-like isoform X2 [Onthophagus taurus]|uniref:transcription initiation factor IIA subunit 1-like isoform X2 n=1 Tax=Onthophagus taurus TaxID=166361 RepID=UPI0039BEB350